MKILLKLAIFRSEKNVVGRIWEVEKAGENSAPAGGSI